MIKIEIIYEDNHLIAVYKPAGMLTQTDQSEDTALLDHVRNLLKTKYEKKGNVFVGMIHRLDRNVSGMVLFAKTSKGASRLSQQFREHTLEKSYHALVEGNISKDKTLINFLQKDTEQKKAILFTEPGINRQKAELSFTILKSNINTTLLNIKLKTGRFHQIRAQLSAIGHPIVGDSKYGSTIMLPNQEIALSSTGLKFKTATSETIKNLIIPYPPHWKKHKN